MSEHITKSEALTEVERIRAIAGDDEAAHSAEDSLRHRVLEYVAAGGEDSATLAAVALKTTDIDFSRWCA